MADASHGRRYRLETRCLVQMRTRLEDETRRVCKYREEVLGRRYEITGAVPR